MASTEERARTLTKSVAVGAMALGITAGSYGIANAASGSGAGSTATVATTPQAAPSAPPTGQSAWGRQRSDETLLTGDAASKVKQVALDKLPGATVVRVETDADGHAAYEAHVVKSDGTPATVYVDKQFDIVSVESR
jgi:hypothetical protein